MSDETHGYFFTGTDMVCVYIKRDDPSIKEYMTKSIIIGVDWMLSHVLKNSNDGHKMRNCLKRGISIKFGLSQYIYKSYIYWRDIVEDRELEVENMDTEPIPVVKTELNKKFCQEYCLDEFSQYDVLINNQSIRV